MGARSEGDQVGRFKVETVAFFNYHSAGERYANKLVGPHGKAQTGRPMGRFNFPWHRDEGTSIRSVLFLVAFVASSIVHFVVIVFDIAAWEPRRGIFRRHLQRLHA